MRFHACQIVFMNERISKAGNVGTSVFIKFLQLKAFHFPCNMYLGLKRRFIFCIILKYFFTLIHQISFTSNTLSMIADYQFNKMEFYKRNDFDALFPFILKSFVVSHQNIHDKSFSKLHTRCNNESRFV